MSGNAVVGTEVTDRDADETRFADPGRADGAAPGPECAVLERPADFVFVLVLVSGIDLGVTRDVVVLGVAMEGVSSQHEALTAELDARHPEPGIRHAVATELCPPADRCVGSPFGDTSVDNIDYATNRTGTVEQRGGSAQHFDLLGQKRLDGRRVIAADRRDVHRRQPFAQHQDTRAILPANDRTTDARTKVARLNPWLTLQGLAQRCCLATLQLRPAQHRGGLDQGAVVTAQRISLDNHRVEFARVFVLMLGCVGRFGRMQRGSDQQFGDQQWEQALHEATR